MTSLLLFFTGLVLLVIGGESLVRGSSKIASLIGISPLVIGLTVVAFGTSSPELAVSISSALNNRPDLVTGNVVGSNLFNILLVLGLSSVLTPLVVKQKLIKIEIPLLIIISLLMMLFCSDRVFGRIEGIIMVAGLLTYTIFVIRKSRTESQEIVNEYAREFKQSVGNPKVWIMNISFIAAGLALLVYGSDLLVESAITFARYLGISELIIGLTVVAAGTSLPELATSVIAVFKGERDIAVGNVIGSNIFNILAVLGITGIISPVAISEAVVTFDLPVMTAVTIASLPILFSGYLISRWEGVLFIFYYAAYTVYLILDASGHDLLGTYSSIMLLFVIPISVITIIIIFVRSFFSKRLS